MFSWLGGKIFVVGRKLFQGQVERFSRQGGNIFTDRWKENQGKFRAENERRKDFQGSIAGVILKSEGESWRFLGFFGCNLTEKDGSLVLKVEELSGQRRKDFRVKEKYLSAKGAKEEAL